MKNLALVAIAALLTILSSADAGLAQGVSGHGTHEDGGHREQDRHRDGDHDRDRHDHERGHGGGPVVYRYIPYYTIPRYVAPYPAYWYYCPSVAAYYPYVIYCPDSWVVVPAG